MGLIAKNSGSDLWQNLKNCVMSAIIQYVCQGNNYQENVIHRLQIWRTTRSSPGTSRDELHKSEVSQSSMFCFESASPENSCFVVALFCFIPLCLRVPVFLNATRRDRNLPPFTSRENSGSM